MGTVDRRERDEVVENHGRSAIRMGESQRMSSISTPPYFAPIAASAEPRPKAPAGRIASRRIARTDEGCCASQGSDFRRRKSGSWLVGPFTANVRPEVDFVVAVLAGVVLSQQLGQ